MTYDEFAAVVQGAGLTPRQCNPIHWQILGGGRIVNYYPHTKRGERFYVDRARRAENGTLDLAIRAARPAEPPAAPPTRIPQYIIDRWQQHQHDGGKLTLEQFYARTVRREQDKPPTNRRRRDGLPLNTPVTQAGEIYPYTYDWIE